MLDQLGASVLLVAHFCPALQLLLLRFWRHDLIHFHSLGINLNWCVNGCIKFGCLFFDEEAGFLVSQV